MVDQRGIEPRLSRCKRNVLPLSLPAHKTVVLGIGNDPISAPYQDAANPFQLTEYITILNIIMSKPYQLVHVENLDTLRAKVINLMPPSIMTATSVTYNQEYSNQLMALPEIIAAVEQFGGIDQVYRIAFNIVEPVSTTAIHCDYSEFNYSFNIPILNFVDTYLKIYTPDPEMTLLSYTNVYGNCVKYWKVDKNRCELIDQVETIYPHVLDFRYPHAVVNEQPTIRINMLIRLKSLKLDCMK